MCDQKPSGSRNKFDEFFHWSRLDRDFWWIPPNQKKEFCGERRPPLKHIFRSE